MHRVHPLPPPEPEPPREPESVVAHGDSEKDPPKAPTPQALKDLEDLEKRFYALYTDIKTKDGKILKKSLRFNV